MESHGGCLQLKVAQACTDRQPVSNNQAMDEDYALGGDVLDSRRSADDHQCQYQGHRKDRTIDTVSQLPPTTHNWKTYL
jgi:hypothetical protein